MISFESFEEMLEFIKENEIEQIDLKFTNLFGGLHHISVPILRAKKSFFEEGIGFDASSIPGFKGVEASDMILIPDIKAAFLDPFSKVNTLSFMCSIYEADSKKEFPLCPRNIAKKAEELLKTKDYANRVQFGPEYEFYVFSNINYKNAENISYYEIDSDEAHWKSDAGADFVNTGYFNKKGKGYHAIPPKDKLFDFRSKLSKLLEKTGIEVKYHHHEGGGAGQVEIEVVFDELLRSADKGQIIKYFAKVLAVSENYTATFMPKPLFNEAGNGMHFHQMLFKDKKPVFFEKGAEPYELSQIALFYIGGVLKHASSLLGITNPSTNSYKRLVPGFEAPIEAYFSIADRSAAIRIPKYATKPEEKRFEFRPPDATGNIYLSMAAMLLAGIDGIENKISPQDNGFLKTEEKKKLLPTSLEEALKSLKEDNSYLTKDGVFQNEFIKVWEEAKQREIFDLRKRTHPYEIELYYDC